jgi:L-asparaginase
VGVPLKPRVLLLSTGGTLGMLRSEPGPLAPSKVSEDVLPWVRGLEHEVDVTVENLYNLDSSDLNPTHWEAIAGHIAARIQDCDGFVVMHGTDTMAWTAAALSFMLRGLPKPVVLTGAQRPIAFVRTDARNNLVHSTLCAAMPIPEVSIWFGRWLFRGNRAIKASIQSYEAFESPDLPPLVEVGVEVRPITPPLQPREPFRLVPGFEPRVSVIPIVPGGDTWQLDAAADHGVRGVVLRGFGAGNIPRTAWPDAIRRATKAGVMVAMHSQCHRGTVDIDAYEGGRAARVAGAVGTGEMTLEAATVKLMYLLGQGLSGESLRAAYARDLAGEGSKPDRG